MNKKYRLSPWRVFPVLCVLLAVSFVLNASAEKAVSVFAATDRHAAYAAKLAPPSLTESQRVSGRFRPRADPGRTAARGFMQFGLPVPWSHNWVVFRT